MKRRVETTGKAEADQRSCSILDQSLCFEVRAGGGAATNGDAPAEAARDPRLRRYADDNADVRIQTPPCACFRAADFGNALVP